MSKLRLLSIQLSICLGIAVVWEVIAWSSANALFFVGSPSTIAVEFSKLLLEEDLLGHFLITGSEAAIGLLIGTVLGNLLGLIFWYSEELTRVMRPFLLAFGTLPIFAFAPLMIVWFGIGFSMKVAMAAFSTVFVAFNQANKGARSVAGFYIETLRGMNANPRQVFRKVIVPGSIDWVLSSMRLNVGFGLLGAFIGEFIASDRGLGFLILRAGGLYNIPRAFAAAIGITALALLLDACARYIENRSHILVQWLSVPKEVRRFAKEFERSRRIQESNEG